MTLFKADLIVGIRIYILIKLQKLSFLYYKNEIIQVDTVNLNNDFFRAGCVGTYM